MKLTAKLAIKEIQIAIAPLTGCDYRNDMIDAFAKIKQILNRYNHQNEPLIVRKAIGIEDDF